MKSKQIFKELNLTEDYPQNWSMEEFKKLTNFAARTRYCDERLSKLASGSGRIVYKIDNLKVLKLAKNKKGVAQNEAEIEIGTDNYFSGIVAKIFEYSDDYSFLEMEFADKLSKGNFKSITGYSFDNFAQELRIFHMSNNPSMRKYTPEETEEHDIITESDFFNDIIDVMHNHDMPAGDLARTSTYGIVNRSGKKTIVLVDAGLTGNTYNNFYKR